MEVNLPINTQYLPSGVIFDVTDADFKETVKPWLNKKLIVNSVDEMPDDPLGFNESYYKINFNNNTLLLYYDLDFYNIVSYQNRYYRNNIEKSYYWSIQIGINGKLNEDDNNIEKVIFSRYALLVPKLPENADVNVYISLTDHNWDWNRK